MNRLRFRKTCLILFCLLLLPISISCSQAGSPDPLAVLSGECDIPVRLDILSPEYTQVDYLDENRTAQLNRLLHHLSLSVTLDQSVSVTALNIDQDPVMTILRQQGSEEDQILFSFEPESVYLEEANTEEDTAAADSLIPFLGNVAVPSLQHLDSFLRLFSRLPEAFPEKVRETDTDLSLRGFGRGKKRLDLVFYPDEVMELFPGRLVELSDSAFCDDLLGRLVFSGKQKASFLYDQSGELIRFTYNGNAGYSEEQLMNISLNWKCLRLSGHQKDVISLKCPRVKDSDHLILDLSRDQDTTQAETGTLDYQIQLDRRADKERRVTGLAAQYQIGTEQWNGEVRFSVQSGKEREELSLQTLLTPNGTEEYAGTLEIKKYSGKIQTGDMNARIRLAPGEAQHWPSDASLKTVRLSGDVLSDAHIREAAGRLIVRKILQLPEEDLEFILEGISPGDLAQ